LMSYDEDFLSDTISAINNYLKEGKLTEKYGAKNDGPRLAVGQRIKYRKFNGKVTKVFVKAGQIYYHISYDAGLNLKSGAHFIDPEAPEIQGNKDHPNSPVKRSYIEGKLNEKDVKISDLWKEYVKKYGKNKAAEKLMDILTMGTWAAWDGDKIKNFKKKLIKKMMKEGKLFEKLDFGKVMDKYNKHIVDNALALAKQHAIKDKHRGSEQTPKLIAIKTINRMKEYRNKTKGDLKNLFQKTINKLEKDYKRIKEGKLNEAKETIFDVAERVMKDKQAYKYKSGKGQVMVDMQSANLLTKVWKKINPKMKKILSDLGYKNPAQLMNTLWAVAKAA